MSTSQRHLLVTGLSITLIALLLLLIFFDKTLTRDLPDTQIIHEIQLAAPSPPPPPATNTPVSEAESLIDLSISTIESPVSMLSMNLEIELPTQDLLKETSSNWRDGIGFDMNGFGVTELDSIPLVVAAPLLAYPEGLSQETGVKEFEIIVQILIDENGNAYLIKIVENPFPQMIPYIENFIPGVQFTPPTLSGLQVKANYIWSLKVQI